MPEGDTIYRAARRLRRALLGEPIIDCQAQVLEASARSMVGCAIAEVESRGKNLLIYLDPGPVLYTHMKMTGSWHLYRPGERWRKPPGRASVAIYTRPFVAVCFNAPVVELMDRARVDRHPTLSQLGPDLLARAPNYGEMMRRLRQSPARPLGEVLLDQRLVAGIGNVYKSEVCFRMGVDPFAEIGRVADEVLYELLRTARRAMRENLDTFRRQTRHAADGERYWVYGRKGRPCRRPGCHGEIQVRRQGDAGRTTYFCPACQTAFERGASSGRRLTTGLARRGV